MEPTVHLDGNVDNAFPWMSSSTTTTASPHTASPHTVSPHDNRDLHLLTPGIPPTPGWVPLLPTPGTLVDPPRQPREGYEWVWYPGGYWAEREIGVSPVESTSKGSGLDSKLRRWKGKSSSKGSQGSVDLEQSPLVARRGSGSTRRGSASSVGLFTPQPHTPFRTERELVHALQHSSDNEPLWGYPFAPVSPGADRGTDSGSSIASTGKGFRRGSWPESQPIIEESGEDETGSQGSATPLGRLKVIGRSREKRKSRSSERGPNDESLSESSDGHTPGQQNNTRKLLHKLAWRKKETAADSDALSLIEEEASSTTQPGLPHWDTVYPGGEARRITTPPLEEVTADGRSRSLFTDVDDVGSDAARSEGDNRSQRSGLNKSEEGASEPDTVLSSDESKLNMSCRNAAAADSSGGSHVHWSDSKREEDEKRKKQLARHKRKLIQSRQAAFSLQVPDHYPNSPLCPANPKHVSGGTGVCVYHGRKQDHSQEEQPFVAELGLQQPVTEDRQPAAATSNE